MKYLVTLLVLLVSIGLTVQTLAEEKAHDNHPPTTTKNKEEAHAKGHGDLNAKMNSLFPAKQQNAELTLRPSIADIKSPAFLSTVTQGNVKLEWAASYGATDYHLQVATDPNFKWLVVNEKFVKATNYNFTQAEPGHRYFWRVAGFKSGNNSSFTKSNFASSAFNVK